MPTQSRAAIAVRGASQEPATQSTFAQARYAAAVASVMPPVGQNRAVGNGPTSASSAATPPAAAAGKNLKQSCPKAAARMSSDAVAIAGRYGILELAPASSSPRVVPGDTANAAPDRAAAASSAGVVTVPAPTANSGRRFAIRSIAASPAGVRNVTSATRMPPAASALATSTAAPASSSVTTG